MVRLCDVGASGMSVVVPGRVSETSLAGNGGRSELPNAYLIF